MNNELNVDAGLRMARLLMMLLLTGLAVWPAPARAEGGDPQPASLQAEQKSSPKTLAPPTVPDPHVAERDAEEAAAALEAREWDDELIRKEVRGPERRPDLEYDVVNGIQSRNVENALHRR
jgi:hypothetical protein